MTFARRTIARASQGLRVGAVAALVLWSSQSARAQDIDDHCMVSVLNRTVQVKADGTWELPNVPAETGQVRARVTCVNNGVTTSGQSDFFTVTSNVVNTIPDLVLGPVADIPVGLAVTPTNPVLTSLGQTLTLSVMATYADGSSKNVTAAIAGTNYTTSNASTIGRAHV